MAKNTPTQCNRRAFLSVALGAGAALGALKFTAGQALAAQGSAQGTKNAAPDAKPQKALIVYFSESGNTKNIAELIQKETGADMARIETVTPYPEDYDTLVKIAKKEQQDKTRPAIKTKKPNLDEYGLIFLGCPNWWSGMPMPVFTFIEENKLDGKTIAPFITHGGGGSGHIIEDLKKEVPHSKVLKALVVPGSRAGAAENDVKKWLEGLGSALIQTTTGNTKIYPDGAY